MAFFTLMSTQSIEVVQPGIQRGRITVPTVQELAFSFCRFGLPPALPTAVAFMTFEEKLGRSTPRAANSVAQLAPRVAFLVMFEGSHGSSANEKVVDSGRNSSVIAGARTERVK